MKNKIMILVILVICLCLTTFCYADYNPMGTVVWYDPNDYQFYSTIDSNNIYGSAVGISDEMNTELKQSNYTRIPCVFDEDGSVYLQLDAYGYNDVVYTKGTYLCESTGIVGNVPLQKIDYRAPDITPIDNEIELFASEPTDIETNPDETQTLGEQNIDLIPEPIDGTLTPVMRNVLGTYNGTENNPDWQYIISGLILILFIYFIGRGCLSICKK